MESQPTHEQYEDAKRVIEEEVAAEIAEEVEYGDITEEQGEEIMAEWLERYHQ